ASSSGTATPRVSLFATADAPSCAMPRPPADLTRLGAADKPFPAVHVMSYIDGYFRQDDPGQVMPEFSGIFTGPTLHVDTGDGMLTPTPQPLVALSEYLETLQEG
ncbi:hypothetical protein NHG85_18235, partial [Limimaricola sp. ASW11-118]|nr:hypothetical protein [Limimaricola litoreus]